MFVRTVRPGWHRIAGAVACALFAGCSADRAQTANSHDVTDSSGVAIITNHQPAWDSAGGWRIDSAPITVIGTDEADPQQQFRYVQGARRLADGKVVLAVESELRFFDATGRYLRTSGGQGDGPGEFRMIYALHRLAGDTLLAADAHGQRTALFSPSGELIRDERLDRERFAKLARWGECFTAYLPDGSRFGCQSDQTIPESPTNRPSRMIKKGWTSPGAGRLRQLRRGMLASPSLDTAYPLSVVAGIEQFGVQRADSDVMFFIHPFYSRSLFAAGGSPLRIVMMLNPAYEFEVWTPTGKLERIVRRSGARRVPTSTERTQAFDAMFEPADRLSRTEFKEVAKEVEVPDSLPAAVSITVTDRGEILVFRDGWLPESRASVYDVFAPDGRWQGVLTFPPRTFIAEVGEDYIILLRLDENDTPRTEVRRLRR